MSEDKEVRISSEAKRKDKLVYLRAIAQRASNENNCLELQKISEQIIEIEPHDAQAHFWLGLAAHKMEMDPAIIENHYCNAIICDPKMSYAYSNLAMLVSKDKNRLKEATDYLLEAIKLDKNNASAYHVLGNVRLKDGSPLNDAEECFRMTIHLQPNSASAHAGLGGVLFRYEFRHEEAQKSYEKALELDPNNVTAYEGLGFIFESNEETFDKAERNFRKAIELMPDNSGLWLRLGFLFHKQNRVYEAIEVCQKSAMLDTENFVPLLIIGSIYRGMGYEDESKKYLMLAEMVIKKDGFTVAEADYYNFACLQSLLGNKKETFKYLELAFQINPKLKEVAKTDPDLDLIRKSPKFAKVLDC